MIRPRPRLDIHIGSHKTGTTAIQAALVTDRDWLRRHGVAYPTNPPEFRAAQAHHRMAHALAKPGWEPRKQLWRFARRLRREAQELDLTLLSAEPIYRHALGETPASDPAWFTGHERYLRRLKRFFWAFDTGIVLYLRHPAAFAESVYKENVAKVRTAPLPGFVEMIERQAALFDYDRHLAILGRVFRRVDLRNYETAASEGLLTSFYRPLGLPPPDTDRARVRSSVPNRGALWLARVSGSGEEPARQRARFLYAARDPDGLFREERRSSLFPSDAARRAFAARHAGAFAVPMFRHHRADALPPTLWTDPMHRDAEAGFARWAAASAELLAGREALRLRHYDPDP